MTHNRILERCRRAR